MNATWLKLQTSHKASTIPAGHGRYELGCETAVIPSDKSSAVANLRNSTISDFRPNGSAESAYRRTIDIEIGKRRIALAPVAFSQVKLIPFGEKVMESVFHILVILRRTPEG